MADKSKISLTFNNQLASFLGELKTLFPDNEEINKAAEYAEIIRKANPRMTIMLWQMYVCRPYGDIIESGDIVFFLEKDYSADLALVDSITEENRRMILTMIDSGMRDPMRNLEPENQAKCMRYLSVLCRLSNAYAAIV